MPSSDDRDRRAQRHWDKRAGSYDKTMGFFDRHLFRDTREWITRRATGDVLEVAIGTGLNLDRYGSEVRLTGVEYSTAMLELARKRADDLGRPVTLIEGDAHQLDFPDHSFDAVVCTFSLCEIADEKRAIGEMSRVLRPGGLLLLADHVASTTGPIRLAQRLLELATIPLGGEHFLRRPSQHLAAAGFAIEERERFTRGVVERVAARKWSQN